MTQEKAIKKPQFYKQALKCTLHLSTMLTWLHRSALPNIGRDKTGHKNQEAGIMGGQGSSCQLAITTGDGEGFSLGCSGVNMKYLYSIRVAGDRQQRVEFVSFNTEKGYALGVIST